MIVSALFFLFRHVGGIYFALALIAATAALTAWGTLVEAGSASHLLAMQQVYGSTLFTAILWGFFLNILVSALRRWPFRKKHIPFLTTHCGLLMILSGVMIKNGYGMQGMMALVAGSANSAVVLPNTFVVQVEDTLSTAQYPVFLDSPGRLKKGKKTDPFPLLEISLLSSAAHTAEELESWFQTDRDGATCCRIHGLPPIPLKHHSSTSHDRLPAPALQIPLKQEEGEIWKIFALETDEMAALGKLLYINSAVVVVRRRSDRQELLRQPLKTFLYTPVTIDNLLISASFEESPSYQLHWEIFLPEALIHTEMTQPLEGARALFNDWKEFIPHPALNIAIDIEQQPTLAWIRKKDSDDALFMGYNGSGEIAHTPLSNALPSAVLAYDGGKRGYGVAMSVSVPETRSRVDREAADFSSIERALRQGVADNALLAPPLALLRRCCEANTDFIAVFLEFLRVWKDEGLWLSYSQLPYAINWQNIPAGELRALQWSVNLMDQMQEELRHNTPASEIPLLQTWPTPLSEQAPFTEKLITICRQLMEAQDQLPNIAITAESTQLFSAYCRVWGLSPQDLIIGQESAKTLDKNGTDKKIASPLHLEAPLTFRRLPAPPLKKAEDNRPLILLQVKEGRHTEKIALSYDGGAAGLKWPIFGGRYLLRFQPAVVMLPWRLRLRDAQQILYAGASQPFSYESTLLLTHTESPELATAVTLSMNYVHETPDGFRFYLSSMSPADQTSVQRIQLAVNYDPAKSLLTYPGAIVLSLGIALFLLQHRTRKGFTP